MTDFTANHLTPDELDDWLAGSLARHREGHLHGCADCRRLADADRALAHLLGALPLFSPAAGFGDRVMARVEIRRPARRKALAAALAAGLLLPMAASVGWSLANPDTLSQLLQGLGSGVGGLGLAAVRSVGSTLLAQPWYPWVRGLLESPARLGLVFGATALAYAGGLVVFRRLMALPMPRVAHVQG
ncbi:MAG TPA: hypothetical protein VFV65_04375 [Gemmatimonadales bacterium]|nr:hypothetical protein [Gemmatimonadales bacterium]